MNFIIRWRIYMDKKNTKYNYMLSLIGFSLLFAYILSFQFEGQVLYGILETNNLEPSLYIQMSIVFHFFGLVFAGKVVKSIVTAKTSMIVSMGIILLVSIPFLLSMTKLFLVSLMISGFASGLAVASWGYILKYTSQGNMRLKVCADLLIISNIVMIGIDVLSLKTSSIIGLLASMGILLFSSLFISKVELHNIKPNPIRERGINKPLLILAVFVFIVTINSGLMYQVVNPSFANLRNLTTWYWAIPYIVAILLLRNLPTSIKRARILYVGIFMVMASFILFMLLGRGSLDYIIIDTFMLGAFGVFDLFWWSILAEMVDLTDNPARVFGLGLAANVFGVLTGGAIGIGIESLGIGGAEVTVIALSIVCITLVMLPPLNHQLVMLLKNHSYLMVYENSSSNQQNSIISSIKTLDPLTIREQEVLDHILSGESNKYIAKALSISESTVKTHTRNIFSKYDVESRAELISTILKNQYK